VFNAEGRGRFTLPGSEPQTVVVYRAYRYEDTTVLSMNLGQLIRAEAMAGRNTEDPSVTRKSVAAEMASMATAIDQVENVNEPGDVVDGKSEIEAFLKALPMKLYADLKEAMTSGLSLFEGKA
jgi:hypothetical protein